MKANPKPDRADLSRLELYQKISVGEAARLNGISPATFRRAHRHLIRKVSARRAVVVLADALDLPPPEAK